jgi:NAD(P)H-hydrate epimerase
MREWENQTWASGITQEAVIERAGSAIARRISASLARPGDRLLVLAGRGHNGDDAKVAAKQLPQLKVELIEVADPVQALDPIRHWIANSAELSGNALILDGLFGIGLNRPLEGAWLDLVGLINGSGLPVCAVDVPSGLDADTGKAMGDTAVRARATITLGAPKQGLLQSHAAESVGRLYVESEIGLVPCPFNSGLNWTCPRDFAAYPPARHVLWHKGDSGHLRIVAGSRGYHGAAVLAALGAQRAHPGLITLIVPENIYPIAASQLRSTMVRPWQSESRVQRPPNGNQKPTALLFGPGLAGTDLPPGMREDLLRAWNHLQEPVIVDASALDWLPRESFTAPGALRVITPHPGEAARLLRCNVADVQQDRERALRELSKQYGGCHVVLKGHQTLVGRTEGPVYINPSGNPSLAQGGAGDVLAGMLAGLLAQPTLADPAQGGDPTKALRYGVWWHGDAADRASATMKHWDIDDLLACLS